MKSLRQTPARPRSGFSLLELLTVIAMITILSGLLLPVLGRAQRRATALTCLNHQKQFALALGVYTGDTGAYVPNSYYGVNLSPDDRVLEDGQTIRDLERSTKWVRGWLEFGGTKADNTNTAFLRDSHLAPYLGSSLKVWVCPEERAPAVDAEGGRHPWRRTVSLNATVSGAISSPFDQTPYRIFRRPEDVPNPAVFYTFMEERADGINSCMFMPGDLEAFPRTSQHQALGNYPGYYHGNGAAVAFADGHAEIHAMKDARTTPKRTGKKLPWQTPSPGNPDVVWFYDHGTVLK